MVLTPAEGLSNIPTPSVFKEHMQPGNRYNLFFNLTHDGLLFIESNNNDNNINVNYSNIYTYTYINTENLNRVNNFFINFFQTLYENLE